MLHRQRIAILAALAVGVTLLTSCAGTLSEISPAVAAGSAGTSGQGLTLTTSVGGVINAQDATLNGTLPDIASVVQQVAPAVVTITARFYESLGVFGSQPREGEGTGFIISADGYIVTNAHVVGDAKTVTVELPDGRVFLNSEVVGRDPVNDLAVIRIDDGDLPLVLVAKGSDLPVGAWVIAIGNALGQGPSVTAGIVSAVGRTLTAQTNCRLTNLIQTDAAINVGNSGGPLFNMAGQVVGINTAVQRRTPDGREIVEGIGFAISIDQALPIIEALIASGDIGLPWLGVELQTVTPGLVARLRLPVENGVVVVPIAGSPIAQTGLPSISTILTLDNATIVDAEDLLREIRAHNPGDRIDLSGVTRTGEAFNISVTLGLRTCGT